MAIIEEHGAEAIDVLNKIARDAVGNRVTDAQKREWLADLQKTVDKLSVV